MKKWIPAGLAVLLVVALTINLTLYFDQQRLNQDVNALKSQRVQNGQERSRIATVGAEQRADMVSTIGQQKGELERIQRLLQVQQASVQGLSQAISNETAQSGSAAANASPAQYQSDLEGVRKDLTDLRGSVDKLKDYAFKLEKSLNLPAPDLGTPDPSSPVTIPAISPAGNPASSPAATTPTASNSAGSTLTLIAGSSPIANTTASVPGPTSTTKPFSDRGPIESNNNVRNNGSGNGNINMASYSVELSAISQNISVLGGELQSLLQRYEKLEAAAASSKVARSNDSVNVPGIDAVLGNAEAQKLASLSYAPQGWPVRGPITSPFGPRPNIFGPAPKATASSQPVFTSGAFMENKGGNNQSAAPADTATPGPTSTGGVSVANVSPTVPANTATPTPTFTPSPTRDVSNITPIIVPGAPNATPSLSVSPTVTPTATITPTVSLTATPGLTPTAKATGSLSPSPKPSLSVSPSPSVSPTISGPSVAIGISGGVGEVGPGMEFHTGIDIGVNEGSEVRATAAGVVEAAGDSGGYGKAVFIRHPGGFMTVYGHNSRLLVVAGQSVKAGELISLSGNTGYSTGPHVHYEVRYQNRVTDPAPFMK